jgi:hypothetical protein
MFGHDTNQDENQDNGHYEGPNQEITAAQTVTPQVTHASPAGDDSAPHPSDAPAAVPTAPANGDTDELLDIKQQALQELTPLVSHLDQTPEEQFRTTMMMIQAADNHELIHTAYEAAKKIANEKERAQALLDIVNEINYFTQHAQ